MKENQRKQEFTDYEEYEDYEKTERRRGKTGQKRFSVPQLFFIAAAVALLALCLGLVMREVGGSRKDPHQTPETELQVIFLEDYVYQDLVIEDHAEVGIYFLYQGYLPDIEIEAVDDGSAKIKEVAVSQVEDLEAYLSYRLGKLSFALDYSECPDFTSGKRIDIEKIRLLARGKEMTLDMEGRLSYCRLSDVAQIRREEEVITPDQTGGFLTLFQRSLFEDVLIFERLEVFGPLAPVNTKVEMTNKTIGTWEEVLPLADVRWDLMEKYESQEEIATVIESTPGGEFFKFKTGLDYGACDPYSDIRFSVVLYTKDESGKQTAEVKDYTILGFSLPAYGNQRQREFEKFADHVLNARL